MKLLDNDLARRLLYLGLFALAVAGMVIAVQNGRTSPTVVSDRDAAIDALVPTQGSDVLRQSRVGIDVADGYLAQLVINGVTIPESQLSGDRGLGQFFFVPGPGQVIETLRGGENCALASYWLAAGGPDGAQTIRWCFSAT